jgi:hypothetical protein
MYMPSLFDFMACHEHVYISGDCDSSSGSQRITCRFLAPQYSCENSFEGGGWALVRRVKQGTKWHPATDNMLGTDAYGTVGTRTSDSTFSVPFASLIKSNNTEVLFATGT